MTTVTIIFGEIEDKSKDIGFTIEELRSIKEEFEKKNCKCSIKDLRKLSELKSECVPEAYLLIIKNGVNVFTKPDVLFKELTALPWDKKGFSRWRKGVINKHARYNINFGDKTQKPDYENGKSTIIAWKDVPELNKIKTALPDFMGEKAKNIKADGNKYEDITKNGIGFHGDTERKRVIAVRTGESAPLHFQWFQNGHSMGERIIFDLDHGDMFVMCEKATGADWKKRKIYTLRHAAGAKKYLKIREKKKKEEKK